ncbi:DUF2157 domain-containing protein [Tenuibacillus multivorans]|uniref:Uncharacterized membrane protein n=1 Tax=Tenuibacillus multivorans TaxID=237069 RepID=A0A1G9ZZZ5_9BACI|nr:DUF2157 domain-containing protein [Tenuibacillus multivorans]GEL78345.1 hypothetical protein TMU01_25800 [Tenuibacillus multivorans]SDN26900.1 Uncharacterized membrane protein [Tenuibacillus multivorans]
MKRIKLIEESKQWVEDGIISQEQRDQIINRYEEKDQLSLIFFFSALLIGLACLTFVAANWQMIPDTFRMIIIISFLIGFYGIGELFHRREHYTYSVFCYVVALAIFGSGIFLTGQMYHYSMNNVFAFIVWGIAAYLLYLSRPHTFILFTGLVIVSVGQIYGLINMHDFDWLLFGIFMVGYGAIVFIKKQSSIAWLFAIAYMVQLIGYSLEHIDDYYWLMIFGLVLYVIGTYVKDYNISRPFQSVSLTFMFVLTIIQSFIYDFAYARDEFSSHFMFYIILTILLGLAIYLTLKNEHRYKLYQLVLFFPVFILVEIASFLAYVVLFLFSVSKILEGYHEIDRRTVRLGTGAFLVSTFIVYLQLAWDFLDKSLFFLVGGIILFLIGFFLERHRKEFVSQKREDV